MATKFFALVNGVRQLIAGMAVGAPTNGQYASAPYALTDAATIAVNWNNGNNQKVTLGGNRTFSAPTNPIEGGRYLLKLTQDATGSRTVTWWSGIKWQGGVAPTLTTTPGKTDRIYFQYDDATYYGGVALNF